MNLVRKLSLCRPHFMRYLGQTKDDGIFFAVNLFAGLSKVGSSESRDKQEAQCKQLVKDHAIINWASAAVVHNYWFP